MKEFGFYLSTVKNKILYRRAALVKMQSVFRMIIALRKHRPRVIAMKNAQKLFSEVEKMTKIGQYSRFKLKYTFFIYLYLKYNSSCRRKDDVIAITLTRNEICSYSNMWSMVSLANYSNPNNFKNNMMRCFSVIKIICLSMFYSLQREFQKELLLLDI